MKNSTGTGIYACAKTLPNQCSEKSKVYNTYDKNINRMKIHSVLLFYLLQICFFYHIYIEELYKWTDYL